MKSIKKIKMGVILLVGIIVSIFTIKMVNAETLASITDVQSLGQSAIGNIVKAGYSTLTKDYSSVGGEAFCVQHLQHIGGTLKNYNVDKYIEIDGKTAIVYDSKEGAGREIKNDLNAKIAYISNQGEGYGTAQNYTNSQKALWHNINDWTDLLFGAGNIYNYAGNDKVSVSGNEVEKKAKEYANSIGDTTSKTTGTNVKVVDNTTNPNTLTKMDLGDGYYRVGPFQWNVDGSIKDIQVKVDGTSVSDIRVVRYRGTSASFINSEDIKPEDKIYIDIKGAKDISSVHVDLKTTQKVTVEKAQIWFLKSEVDYQNIIYVVPSEITVDAEGEGHFDYGVKPSPVKVGLQKVDDRGGNTPLQGVGFVFKAQVLSYDCVKTNGPYTKYHEPQYNELREKVSDGWTETWYTYEYEWREHTMYIDGNTEWDSIDQNNAQVFKTNSNGIISVPEVKFKTRNYRTDSRDGFQEVSDKFASSKNITAVEVSNPYYGYSPEIGKEYSVDSVNETKLLYNHQKYVKLSGYVWLDDNAGKTNVRNNLYDQGSEKGINGITVYLKNSAGQTVKTTTTSELGLYSEIEGGEYQFTDVDLDALPGYYIEYEYCGITYQSVDKNLETKNGSKAIDTNSRNILDNKFSSVDGNSSQNLNVNGVNVNYNRVNGQYKSEISGHSGCNVSARTDEAGYNLYSDFEPTMEEIRYINLGLFEKEQTDYALSNDLYNVRVDVNGKSHVYRYGTTRYSKNGEVNEESSWNLGVKFQNNRGTYNRAIYTSDAEFESQDKNREIKVYATYKIALKNESTYLGRINNILSYCDTRMNLVSAGTTVNEQNQIGGNINYSAKQQYNDKYSKYIVYTNTVIEPGKTEFIYVQFEMNREAVLSLVNNGEVLNSVAEINSYTTFKDYNENAPVAVLDNDSVPGNIVPGQIDTYEDDTDAATSLKLELKNARAITGTVFVDSTGKESDKIYTNQERKGNGIFDNGEKTLEGIEVKLRDTETGNTTQIYDENSKKFVEATTKTDANGNFEFVGFIPGDYVVVYIWGDKEYKVQYYKGTIYDESRDQSNVYWYKDNVDSRKTDALDNSNTRTTIESEMKKITKNNLEDEINKAYESSSNVIKTTKMDSITPTMSISVEYETTMTDGTVDQVRFAISNVDFGIVERPKQQIDMVKRVSGFKITLANGQILVDATVDENGKVSGLKNNLTYMGPTSINQLDINGIIRAEMDSELIEGATLDTVYTIKVTNLSEQDYTSQRYYYYGNKDGAQPVRFSTTGVIDYLDSRLLTSDAKWQLKDQSYLNEMNASEKDNSQYVNSINTYFTSQLSKELATGESNEITLSVSKLLASSDDNTFDNKSEIVDITKTDGFSIGTPVKVSWDNGKFFFDNDNSETVVIIPSTGENKNYVLPTIIGIVTITILGVGVFLIKKYVVDKK